jgi:hypothetical protein
VIEPGVIEPRGEGVRMLGRSLEGGWLPAVRLLVMRLLVMRLLVMAVCCGAWPIERRWAGGTEPSGLAPAAEESLAAEPPAGESAAGEPRRWLGEAVTGAPFGVARLELAGGIAADLVPMRLQLEADDGRLFYPVIDFPERLPAVSEEPRAQRQIGRGGLIDRLQGAVQAAQQRLNPDRGVRIQFLFTGDEPLEVRIRGDLSARVQLTPAATDAAVQRRVLDGWWQAYVRLAMEVAEAKDVPPLIETYLVANLAKRLALNLPDLRPKPAGGLTLQPLIDPLSSLSLLLDPTPMRRELLLAQLQLPPPIDRGAVALPPAPQWIDFPAPPVPDSLPIEPMARQVPPECFYVRFGSFANFLWFQSLGDQQGADLTGALTLQGLDYQIADRVERLLSTRLNLIAKLFGDAVVADMALIGNDLYLQDGPALGVLFEAKVPGLLQSSLRQERRQAANRLASDGGRLENLKIGEQTVELLSTADQRVRSFMVDRGRFVLITSSRRLAERFIEVSGGEQPSLADDSGFAYARLLCPLQNDYSLLAYFSAPFFRQLLGPAYQIELRRRLQAVAAVEVVELASLVARHEGEPSGTVEDLVRGGYLPGWFQTRPDGSHTQWDGRRWLDSVRGARGSMVPICDVAPTEVWASEAEWYSQQSERYRAQWQQTDPLLIGIRRYDSPLPEPDVERLAIEAYVAPFVQSNYGWLRDLLGPPTHQQIRLPESDVVNVQAFLAAPRQLTRGQRQDHFLFVGLKDMAPPSHLEAKGLIEILRLLRATPAYLGAWPYPGILDRLPLGLGGGPPDALGFSRLLIGLWRWQGGGFSLLSFDRGILEQTIVDLQAVPADDPAQVRLQVNPLAGTKLEAGISQFWYRRATAASLANLKLLDALDQQLGVAGPEALAVAEELMDARLRCPVGGAYRYDAQSRSWQSSLGRLEGGGQRPVPADYRAPWLEWLRGGRVHLTQLSDRLILTGQLDVKPPEVAAVREVPVPEEPPLPSMPFDIFKLPFGRRPAEPAGESPPAAVDPQR